MLTVTNPMGETTTNYYGLDWANPLIHTTNNIKYTLSPMNKNVVFDYDANFRKIDQTVAAGTSEAATTYFEYDAVGNLTRTTDPRSKMTMFDYDARNRRIWMDDPIASDRNNSGHTMNWQYDPVGNKRFETRADNATREWRYDSMNRLTDTYGFAGAVDHTHYDHDAAGNVTGITDAKGAQYAYYYDQLNRKVSQFYPVDATGVSRYDAWYRDIAGNIIRHDSPEPNVQIFEYDTRNRLTLSYWWSNVGPSVVTSYDAASRVTSVVTNNGETTVAYGYDNANRQVWEEQTLAGYPTRRVNTPRDGDGNRTSLEVPGAYWISYGYTQRNQLASIGNFATFTYDASGNMTNRQGQWYYPSPTRFDYDDLNRPTQAEQEGVNGWIFGRSHYQYDKVGRETATWRDEDTGSGSGWGERFEYEVNDQVKKAWYRAQNVWTTTPTNALKSEEFAYTPDKLNRVSVTTNGAVTNYTMPNGMNQYTSVANQAIGYDDHFNIASYNGASFIYDAANRLVGGSMQATYDGLGRCVRRVTSSGTRLYTYDGWKPILEWNGNGAWQAWNIYGAGPDEILARNDATFGATLYKQDKQGNVVALLNANGNVLEKYFYDAFGYPTVTDYSGNERGHASSCGNRFLFTGREWIPELGIYDYRHRYYHPGLGRFLQADPTGFDAGDMNLFRYCGDDPVDRSDPSGLYGIPKSEWTEKESQRITAIQNKAIDLAERAKRAIDHAREHPEDKSSKPTMEAFGKKFGPATDKNMAKVSDDLGRKLAALRDDGRNGYWVHRTNDAKLFEGRMDPNKVPAFTHLGDKNIWMNLQHRPGWSDFVLTWAIDHEAGHSAALLRDLGYKVESWRYNAISNPTRLMNADSSTDFVHEVNR